MRTMKFRIIKDNRYNWFEPQIRQWLTWVYLERVDPDTKSYYRTQSEAIAAIENYRKRKVQGIIEPNQEVVWKSD
jgi:hypothetical protein